MDVVTWGEVMVAMTPLEAGTLDNVAMFQKKLAGAESNVAIGLTRLGHKVAFLSNVGDDSFGRFVLKTLRGEGVDVSKIRCLTGYQTGVFFKEFVGDARTNIFYYRRGSAASNMTESVNDLSEFRDSKILFVTGITPALSETNLKQAMTIIQRARDLGMTIVFDPNIRLKLWGVEQFRPALLEIARRSDIVLPGVDEGEMLVGERSPETIAEAFLDNGATSVVVKLGSDGAFYKTQSHAKLRGGYVPAIAVNVVNEIGAGDAFSAGLLSGLLDRFSLEGSVRRACALGALAVTGIGDYESLPYRQDLDAFLYGNSKPER